jgi:hypothetical protein
MALPPEWVKHMWWEAWGTLYSADAIAAWLMKYQKTIKAHPKAVRQFLQEQGKAIQQNWMKQYDNEFLMVRTRRRLMTIDIWIEETENLLNSHC